MNFVLNMAWREIRASWPRLVLFFLCIAIGVGSIVSLRSLVQNLQAAVVREVRSVLAADVHVGGNRPWSEEGRKALEHYSKSSLVTGHTEVFDTQTMVRATGETDAPPVIVQLRAVQEQFPLYGEVQLTDGVRYAHALLKERGVFVAPGLLARLNVKVGDELKIGRLTFTIRGAVERLPGNANNPNPFFPRVVVDYAAALEAGLTGFGSRVDYAWLFKTREGQEGALVEQLRYGSGATSFTRLYSFRQLQNFVTEGLWRVEGFLGLVGLVILVLGGIGIASVTRVFVRQKLKTIAILKCLGGENRHVLSTYLAQVVALSLVGSLAGLLLAGVVTLLVARYAAGLLPIELEAGLTWEAALQGVGMGLLVTLLFAMPPLLEIRQVKPILVLRQNAAPRRRRVDRVRLGAVLLVAPGLLTLATWQSGSFKSAAIFLGGVAATAIILGLTGAVLMRLLSRMRRLPSFALRQGIGSLYRPGNQTQVTLLTVGLGALFVIAVRLQQVNVLSEFDFDLSAAPVDMLLIDVQKDQHADVAAAITRLTGTAPDLIPIVQGRTIGISRDPNNTNRPSGETRRRLGGERLSYRFQLAASEEIIAGKFWEPTPSTEPEISIEERYSRDLGLAVNDKLIFDITGRRIEARVTSIRRVERRLSPLAFHTRFPVIFRPGALEAAPQMFVGAIKGPPPGAPRARLQREFVEQLPNVTVIDGFDTIAELQKRAGQLSFAVSFVGGFVFLCGVLILTGSIAMTKFDRLYEAAILKTLGAEKKLIIGITLIEYSVLGLLAGLIGSGAASALTWAISKYALQLDWQFRPATNLAGLAITLLLVVVVGTLASWDVMMKKPLGLLRAE